MIRWVAQDDLGVRRRVWLPLYMGAAREGRVWRRVPVEVLGPLGALCVVPIGVVMGAIFAGPFVVAITVFSPIAATLILLHVTILTWLAAGLGRYTKRVVAGSLRAGVCPACQYEIGGAVVSEAGVCRCPECGAGWDMTGEGTTRVVVSWKGGASGVALAGEDLADAGHAEAKSEFALIADVEQEGVGGEADLKPPAVG